MKLTFKITPALKSLLSKAASVFPARDNAHPFDKMLISVNGDQDVMLGMANEFTAARLNIPCSLTSATKKPRLCVPGKLVLDIMAQAEDGSSVDMILEKGTLTVETSANETSKRKRSYKHIPVIDMDANPDPAFEAAMSPIAGGLNWDNHGSLDAKQWIDCCSVVIPTADKGTAIDNTPGIYLELEEDRVNLVATNCVAMGFTSLQVSESKNPRALLLHRDYLAYVNKLLGEASGQVALYTNNDQVCLLFPHDAASKKIGVVTTQLPNADKFAHWSQHVPTKEDGLAFRTTVGAMLQLVARAEVISRGNNILISASANGNEITISAGEAGGLQITDMVAPTSISGNGKFTVASEIVKRSLRNLDKSAELDIMSVEDGCRLVVTPVWPVDASNPMTPIIASQVWGTMVTQVQNK